MYIHETQYNTPLNKYHKLREFMLTQVYSNMDNVQYIMNLIGSKIDCLDITYDAARFTICINIKKTTMRRAKGYKASSMYYYGIMNSVFTDFFNNNPHIAVAAKNWISSPINDMEYNNLINVYCIGDKAVEIRL